MSPRGPAKGRHAFAAVLAALALVAAWRAAGAGLQGSDTSATGDYAGGSGARATVRFAGNLASAVQITVDGIANAGKLTTIAGGPVAGIVNFGGPFSTLCDFALPNGRCIRITAGIPGCHLIATFRARVDFSGAPSADVGIKRNAPVGASPPDVLNPRLRYATSLATNWTTSAAGLLMPLVGAAAGESNLGAARPSGWSIDHEVALRFDDSAAIGLYSTTVRWTATTN